MDVPNFPITKLTRIDMISESRFYDPESPKFDKMNDPKKFSSESILLYLLILFLISMPVDSFAFNPEAETDLPLLIRTFEQDQSVLNRYYNIRNSSEYFDRFERFYNDYINQMENIDFDQLPHDSQVDFLLLKNHIKRLEFEMIAYTPQDLIDIAEYIYE
jgi:hypothetical protein